MAKSASTTTRTYLINAKLKSNACKVYRKVEYYSDAGAWVEFDDIHDAAMKTSRRSQRKKYINNQLIPLASTCNFSVVNKDAEYSPNSGTSKDGILKKNRKVKIWWGYRITDDAVAADTSVTLSAGTFFYTKASGAAVVLDSANTGGTTDTYFTDLFVPLYDSETYDDSTYAPSGYSVHTINNTVNDWGTYNSFTVTTNSTNGTIYYRHGDDLDALTLDTTSAGWTNAGATVNGTKTVTVTDGTSQYLQVAVVWDGVGWGDSDSMTALSYNGTAYIEWLRDGVYYLDDPVFEEPSSDEIPIVYCDGRDAWKKAIETKLNLSDLSGGVYLDALIKTICDRTNISYTASSIAGLTSFSQRTLAAGLGDEVGVDEILEYIMEIIGNTYQMWIDDDDYLHVDVKPTDTAADHVFDYRHYTRASKSFDTNRQLQRITFTNANAVVDAEEQLATATYTTDGAKTLSWSDEAVYKRFTVTLNSGTMPTITFTGYTNTSAVFAITSSAAYSVTITAYGNVWSSTIPSAYGEAGNYENTVANDGSTTRIVNPLLLSDAEAKTISEDFIDQFGDPAYTIDMTYSFLHALVEVNDKALMWGKYLYTDDLYWIVGYDHVFGSETNAYTTVYLEDSGDNFGTDINYDETPTLTYDIGLKYEMRLGPTAKESDIDTTSYRHNVDFA